MAANEDVVAANEDVPVFVAVVIVVNVVTVDDCPTSADAEFFVLFENGDGLGDLNMG